MFRSKVAFTVDQVLSDGSMWTVEMVRFETAPGFPGRFLNRGTTGEKVSPVGSGALKEPGTGEPAPRSSPEPGIDRGSPVSIRERPSARNGEETHNLKDELAAMRDTLADVSLMVAALYELLGPSDAEAAALKDRLRDTHGARGTFRRDAIERRKPIFKRLNDLSEKWSAPRRERRDLLAVQRNLQRHITETEKRLASERRKGKQ